MWFAIGITRRSTVGSTPSSSPSVQIRTASAVTAPRSVSSAGLAP
jgi:hypothetical protein